MSFGQAFEDADDALEIIGGPQLLLLVHLAGSVLFDNHHLFDIPTLLTLGSTA